jgi:predicted membrane-bound mannosyltransferase
MRTQPTRKRRNLGSPPRLQAFLRDNWLLIVILCVGVGVRLYAFGSFPPGLNQDEASTGYDAWALLHYGIDRHGFHDPVIFVSWGSGQNALYAYLAIPFFLLFGVSVSSLRAVNLLAGVLTLPVFYFLVRRTRDKTLALIATFLLAICPWHIVMSRWALEANVFPALFLFGVLFLCRAQTHSRSAYLAAVFLGFSLWAYGPAYLVTPVFLALAALSLLWRRPRSWRVPLQAVRSFASSLCRSRCTSW